MEGGDIGMQRNTSILTSLPINLIKYKTKRISIFMPDNIWPIIIF